MITRREAKLISWLVDLGKADGTELVFCFSVVYGLEPEARFEGSGGTQ
jgi:hypothetical protein